MWNCLASLVLATKPAGTSVLKHFFCCSQVQAEVKKAWLRRSLALDIKQKARVVSSTGGGSCYYGGMASHATTQSICLSAQGTILARGVALGVRSQLHVANLPGYTPSETAGATLPTVQQSELRRADSMGALYDQNGQNTEGPQEEEEDSEKHPSLYFIAEDHSGSVSPKDLETIL